MKVAINIISSASIYAPKKIEDLKEKLIVPNMMTRRRLTRNAKILMFLSHECGFENGKIVYASSFGELSPTAEIAKAILNKTQISPTLFQNSVYNSAPSYLSLLSKDKDEIITISSGTKSSLDALKTAALQALISNERVFCSATESLDIENIEEINSCTKYLEAGAAVILEIAKDTSGAIEIEKCYEDGIINSLQHLFSVVNMHKDGFSKILVTL